MYFLKETEVSSAVSYYFAYIFITGPLEICHIRLGRIILFTLFDQNGIYQPDRAPLLKHIL